jgi:ribosomal protein L32E
MMPSGHKAFLVNNTRDVELLLMHNKTFAAEYVPEFNMECSSKRLTWT